MNNQTYYIRDLPARNKGNVKVSLTWIPKGKYVLEMYRIGYAFNDAYTAYLSMGKPSQLTKQQVTRIKQQNDGSPVSKETLEVSASGTFERSFSIWENDVYLLLLKHT